MPVVRDDRVVGIVTRANLLQALAALCDVGVRSPVSDAVIRRRILDEIRREPSGQHHSINVVVCDGKVDLWGSVFDERERQALRVIAETLPGSRRFTTT